MSIFGNWGRRRSMGLASLAGLAADPTPPPVAAEVKAEPKLAKDARRVVTGFVAGRMAKSENYESNGVRLDINGKPFATRASPNSDVVRVCPGNVNTIAQRQAANAILTSLHAGVSLVTRDGRLRKNKDGTRGDMIDPRIAISGRRNRRAMLFAPKGGCFEVVVGKRQREQAAETFIASTIAQQRSGGGVPDSKMVAKVRAEQRKKAKIKQEIRQNAIKAQKLRAKVDAAETRVAEVATKPGSDKGRAGRVAKAQKAAEKAAKSLAAAVKATEKKQALLATMPG